MAHILLADDDKALRDLAARALEADGHKVATASDGTEAAQLLEAGHYDLLVTDVEMPGCGGFELVRDFAARKPRMRFLLVSGFIEKLESAPAGTGGKYVTLAKPFTLERLRAEVSRLLR
ncbi:MAG: response regulator [Afipia sp.]